MDYPNPTTRPCRSSTKAAAQRICQGIFVLILLLLSPQPLALANPLSNTPLLPMLQTAPPDSPSPNNTAPAISMSARWSDDDSDSTGSMAWGDVDNDGDLDLAVGNGTTEGEGAPNKVYLNEDGVLTSVAAWSSDESDESESMAWGDVDDDGDLDLAVGNSGAPNRLYLNEGGVLTSVAAWSSDEANGTQSVAWGDVDNDGDLDLAIGNRPEPNKVYLNEGGVLTSGAAWSSDEADESESVAWGDVDDDGDLDLAVGNDITIGSGAPNRLYLNEGGVLTSGAAWSSDDINFTYSVAWGDVDNDGDLDLAAGNHYARNKVYLNEGGVLNSIAAWSADEPTRTDSVAWGDMDNDGDLDLAVGNWMGPNKLYLNEGGVLNSGAAWSSDESDVTKSVAWGDVDNDGDLDLAIGNHSDPNKVYLNEGGVLNSIAAWSSDESGRTLSVAWGDVDNDGDLDLAVGNEDRSNKVYLNEGGVLTSVAAWSSDDSNDTESIAWGDVDNDGDLDLAVGNDDGRNKVYLNEEGVLTSIIAWSSDESDDTQSVVWGDVDNDGDLDLAVGNYWDPDRVYRNKRGVLSSVAAWSSGEGEGTFSVAWGDVDNDGDLDLAVGNLWEPTKVYLNRVFTPAAVGQAPSIAIDTTRQALTGQLPLTNFYGTPTIQQNGLITIPYTISASQVQPLRAVRAQYSLNGGGEWQEATGWNDPTEQSRQPQIDGTYIWDVYASGFFGQSDNVVIRLVAHLGCANSCQRAYVATQTLPLRVRGYQARVISDDGTGDGTENGSPVSNSIVFRLPAGQVQGAEPIGGLNQPFLTDGSGYLAGRGELKPDDQLVALQPITGTRDYVLYHTSAAPTETGLDMFTVDDSVSAQELSVSADNPLALFNLDVALEWDARKDTQYLGTLEHDIVRASEILYDLTNGQAALGSVRVFHNAKNLPAVEDPDYPEAGNWQPWVDAHVRIYATNRMRPSASIGGIVSTVFTETIGSRSYVYTPGQIQMGSIWNRYGETTGSLGEDWPRTLAHELGHYLFFLDDNYLGLNDQNVLIPIRDCRGAMSNIYRDDFSEFHPQADWNPTCSQTLSERLFGRSDWSTIGAHYPQLQIPTGNYDSLLKGPSILPVAVTQIEQYSVDDVSLDTSTFPEDRITVITGTVELTPTLDVPIFYLSENNEAVQMGKSARAFLLQNDWLVDLGRPNLGEVVAHGARPGDRICVTELAEGRLGCEEITLGDNQLVLRSYPLADWQPSIRVTPETTATIGINLTGVRSGLVIKARHFPKNGPAFSAITLRESGESYVGDFELIHASPEGHMHVWVDSDQAGQRREAVVDYSMGGSPAFPLDRNGFSIGRGGFSIGRAGFSIGRAGFSIGRAGFSIGRAGFSIGRAGFSTGRGGFSIGRAGFSIGRAGFSIGRAAPAMSSDGQVVLIGDGLEFDPGEFYTLQAAAVLPDAPAWATVVGNGYWLSASAGAPDLTNSGDTVASIGFQYLGADVPQDRETYLTLYYWNEGAQKWTPLPTEQDPIQNFVAASTTGPGLYALMYSLDIPLTGQGWDLFSYPVLGSRAITQALASIEPYYSIVYHHDRFQTDLDQQWKVYAQPPVPAWVNSLTHLEFGQTYWITATHTTSITLQLADSEPSQVRAAATAFTPPATYYGTLQPSANLEPTAGMSIEAWIGDTLCGTGETRVVDDQIGFVVIVRAGDGGPNAGCGKTDALIRFEVAGQALFPMPLWTNEHVRQLSLTKAKDQPIGEGPSGEGSPTENDDLIENSRLYLPLITEP